MDKLIVIKSIIFEIVSCDNYIYDYVQLDAEKVTHLLNAEAGVIKRSKKTRLKLDCVFAHYFLKELSIGDFFRKNFIINVQKWDKIPDSYILNPTKKDLIDYNWNERVCYLVRERCELDHALSWLSTLGGAFSALGDYFEKFADTAGKISAHQLKLALRLGDPNIACRCRLYLSLSLIQKKEFKTAKRMIKREYSLAKNQIVVDERLLKMCKGIWSKLQYEHELYLNSRKVKS